MYAPVDMESLSEGADCWLEANVVCAETDEFVFAFGA